MKTAMNDGIFVRVDVWNHHMERIAQLEALLHELIDIEGPLPGHVMWYRKVCESLGIQSETEAAHLSMEGHLHNGIPTPYQPIPDCFCERCTHHYRTSKIERKP